jgi:hypothetical protein
MRNGGHPVTGRVLALSAVLTMPAIMGFPYWNPPWLPNWSSPAWAEETEPSLPLRPATSNTAIGVPGAVTVEGTSATIFEDQDIRGILGRGVRSMTGEDMGRIVDVIVSRDGQVVAAVIDFGGFLGVGSRKIAVDWRALHFATEAKPGLVTLEMTQSQVREAPEYKEGKPVVVLGALKEAPSSGPATTEVPEP